MKENWVLSKTIIITVAITINEIAESSGAAKLRSRHKGARVSKNTCKKKKVSNMHTFNEKRNAILLLQFQFKKKKKKASKKGQRQKTAHTHRHTQYKRKKGDVFAAFLSRCISTACSGRAVRNAQDCCDAPVVRRARSAHGCVTPNG